MREIGSGREGGGMNRGKVSERERGRAMHWDQTVKCTPSVW